MFLETAEYQIKVFILKASGQGYTFHYRHQQNSKISHLRFKIHRSVHQGHIHAEMNINGHVDTLFIPMIRSASSASCLHARPLQHSRTPSSAAGFPAQTPTFL